MKRTVQVILTGVLALILPVLACAGPYAPAVEIPDSRYKEFFSDMPKDGAEMLGMWPIVKKEKIPDTSDVVVPAYPGAVVVKLRGRARVGRREYIGLADMEMVSTDDFEKVRDFYAKRLAGWNSNASSGEKSIRWAKAGKVEVNSNDMEEPHVWVAGFSSVFGHGKRAKKLVSGAKTLIVVYYMPK